MGALIGREGCKVKPRSRAIPEFDFEKSKGHVKSGEYSLEFQ